MATRGPDAPRPRRVRLGLIGCGKMGRIHRKAALELARGEEESYYKGGVEAYLRRLVLVAAADPGFADTGPDADGVVRYRDYRAMLRRRFDALVLAAPTAVHYPIAADCLGRGIPLLIEKPVAETCREVKALKDMAEREGVFVLPGHVERYNPVTFDILEILRHRVYGRVLSYRFTRTSRRPKRIPDSIIVDKLVHDLDLLHLFFGRPAIADARFTHGSQGVAIEASLVFTHRNGVRGEVLSSWRTPRKERSIVIQCERGEVRADFTKKTLFVDRYHEFPKSITGYGNNQVKDQLADFVAGVYGCAAPLVTLDDAVRSARLIDRIRRLAEKARGQGPG